LKGPAQSFYLMCLFHTYHFAKCHFSECLGTKQMAMTMSAQWLIEESLGGVPVVSDSSQWVGLVCNKNAVDEKQKQNYDCCLKPVHSDIEKRTAWSGLDVFAP